MVLRRLLPMVLTSALLGAAPAVAGSFLAECEDLPLAPGLSELPGGTLFDSPNGRIVEAAAAGKVPAGQVSAFYAQTLPQLGWTKVGESTYHRDNEILRIEVDARKTPTSVRFSVVPQ